jgi:TonB-dependent receptor
MQTLDVDKFHFNVGLRVENTSVAYVAHAALMPTDSEALATNRQQHSYTDLFPSFHVKYALDENTNLRAAFTRGIARPDYSALAPTFSAVDAVPNSRSQGLSAGNPALLPEHSWNTDLLAEHFFNGVAGVISGGFFYKDIRDFFFDRTIVYTGPVKQYNPRGDTLVYYVTQPQNGPTAHLWGVEFDLQNHLTFLPGALKGIGFDVNWTHVESRASVPLDQTVGYCGNANTSSCATADSVYPYKSAYRHSPIPRQFPNIFNVALLYDYAGITFRLSGQYTAASIYQYGSDGTSNPQSGDQYNYEHWQVDGSAVWNFWKQTAVQVQALNLNNETFGFFTGTPGNRYNNQREYYGTTLYVGLRQGF